MGRTMAGERRIVTMLFCDIVGSTAIAEGLDPEEWTEIMNGAYEDLIAPVYRYEGTLARLMGDAIFALFGAPVSHEDDPQRAVAAGLDIVEGMAAYREKLLDERGFELNVRVGINTGPVVVGEVGSAQRVEYTAMGDAVNVAARMEQTAEPGTVQITADTQRLVGPFFDVVSRGDIEVKGKSEPVNAFRVLGRSEVAAVGRPSTEGIALVGRDREIATLRRSVDEVLEGRGRFVSLIGEAGLGKSRLIEETRRYWNDNNPRPRHPSHIRHLWEAWQCVSYDTTRPYAQYQRMLASIAGIGDTDPPPVVRDKLAGAVGHEEPEWQEPHLRVWRSLFGVTEPGEDRLEGEAFRRALFHIVTTSTRALGSEPRLFVFEDLHWCDEASMDLLIETSKLAEDLPFLFLFAYRPDRSSPSWRLKRWLEAEHAHRSIELPLAPLSDEQSGALIDQLLPHGADAVRAEILARTDGNPLFVTELAAAVDERGPGDAIPATLQALFMARLDALDPGSRRTLQLAAVVGRSFVEPVLEAVAGDGAALRGQLATLERVGLIRQTAHTPERAYAFHHSLTQEAIAETILRRERRELHRIVGTALEGLYADRLEEFAPVLAEHFRRGEDDVKVLRYETIAGDEAARLDANADAVTHLTAAIEAAERLGRTSEALAHLYPSRGRSLELSGRYPEAVENYERMRALGGETNDGAVELAAQMSLTTLYATPTPLFDPERGRLAIDETVQLARRLGDRRAESKALWNLMNLHVFGGGDKRVSVEAGERSLALAREVGSREQIAFTLNDLWRPYAITGDLAAAEACLDEARPLWREFGNTPMLSENLVSSARLYQLLGRDDASLALAEEALRLAEESGNLWNQSYARMQVSSIKLDRADLGPAIGEMHRTIDLAERAGFLAPQATTRAKLAWTYAFVGDIERARALIALAEEVTAVRIPVANPTTFRAKAEICLLAGDVAEAQSALDLSVPDLLPDPSGSIELAITHGRVALASGDVDAASAIADEIRSRLDRERIREFVAEVELLAGRALAAAGDPDAADERLRRAEATAVDLGHRVVLWEIVAERGRLLRGLEGNERLATARRLADEIAATLDDPGMRASFLSRPEVADLRPATRTS
jgi:class 3 adenylate cyclase/tetratricopeptide (TPR) repeat protein